MSVAETDKTTTMRTMVYELNTMIKTVLQATGRATQFATEGVYRHANRLLKEFKELVDEVRNQGAEMEPGVERDRVDRAIERAERVLAAHPPYSVTQIFLAHPRGDGGSDPGFGSTVDRPEHYGPPFIAPPFLPAPRLTQSVGSADSSFDQNRVVGELRNAQPARPNPNLSQNSFNSLSGIASMSRPSSIAPSHSISNVDPIREEPPIFDDVPPMADEPVPDEGLREPSERSTRLPWPTIERVLNARNEEMTENDRRDDGHRTASELGAAAPRPNRPTSTRVNDVDPRLNNGP